MLISDDGHPLAVIPLCAKTHSYGEFVFDWGWAEAHERYGSKYYPKLITAIPFSPVAGPRLSISVDVDVDKAFPEVRKACLLFRYEDLCAHSTRLIDTILAHCELPESMNPFVKGYLTLLICTQNCQY